MISVATGAILVYALLVLAGGVVGYLKARSQPSLISGLISGVALAIAAYISIENPAVGFGLATVLAVGLVIVFAMRFQKNRKFMPAGLMTILSAIAALGFVTFWILAVLD